MPVNRAGAAGLAVAGFAPACPDEGAGAAGFAGVWAASGPVDKAMAAAATATEPTNAEMALRIRQFSSMTAGCQLRLLSRAERFAGQETTDVLVEKGTIRRISTCAGRMSP